MNSLPEVSRRGFLQFGAAAAAFSTGGGLVAPAGAEEPGAGGTDTWRGLKVGIATYTFSKLSLDVTIQDVRRVGVKYVSIKESHLPLKSTAEERKAVVQKFRDAGITPLSCGVVSMSDSETEIRNAFEYARDAAIPTIVCKPTRQSLSLLDKLVQEFDIRLAIHNHGPEDKVWPSPLDVWDAIQPFDKRIGLCIDVGHTARCGVDPAESIRKCGSRLYDLHLKDISKKEGKSLPVEVGRGVLDVRKVLETLIAIKYPYHVGLEYEKDMTDPLPGVAESIGYVHGVLATLPG
ncbi:MAG: sugar phosphate isomerase/epimerase [Isosphaeraceae bacterium]|nr:sugar phosphate isomerase/epimerase [Isosphaeraceae bacterium]